MTKSAPIAVTGSAIETIGTAKPRWPPTRGKTDEGAGGVAVGRGGSDDSTGAGAGAGSCAEAAASAMQREEKTDAETKLTK